MRSRQKRHLRYLVQVALLLGGLELAGAALRGQRTAVPGDQALLRQARSLCSQQRWAQAEQILRPLVQRDPGDASALTLLAEVALGQGSAADALVLFERALFANPRSIETNNAFGHLLLQQKHYPEAMDRFETTLSVSPRDTEARQGELAAATSLAAMAESGGHPEAALEVLKHARATLPDDPKLLLELGNEAAEMHEFTVADEAYAAGLRLNPHDDRILYAMAMAELDGQHLSAAEEHLRDYLILKPTDASAQFGLGHILAMEMKTAEARAAFERSIRLQPVQTESYYQLGELLLQEHMDQDASPLFVKTLARNPQHGGALTGLGILAFRAKRDAEAERYLAQAVQVAPEYQRGHYYHGLVLQRLGRTAEADAELHRAVQLDQIQQAPPGAVTADPSPAALKQP